MRNFYAQINENNICIGISDLCRPIHNEKMIKIPSMDLSLRGKKYNNGVWEEVEKVIEVSEKDLIQSQILLNQQELAIAQKSQDEVLAAILLAQQTA